jgi:hypothetical protein
MARETDGEKLDLQVEDDREIMLEEYRAILELHKHFDTMNLSLMSTITAAVFILWGILLGTEGLHPLFLVSIATVVFGILTTWIRYMSIHRSIIVRKLARASAIEERLGMMQNRLFQYNDEVRIARRRPGAQAAEIGVYWLLTTMGIGVMVAGCLPPRAGLVSCGGGWKALAATWYVIPVALFHGFFALYWGVTCRTVVAEVIPYYELPSGGLTRWALVNLGRYRDLHDEAKD